MTVYKLFIEKAELYSQLKEENMLFFKVISSDDIDEMVVQYIKNKVSKFLIIGFSFHYMGFDLDIPVMVNYPAPISPDYDVIPRLEGFQDYRR